MGWTRQRDASAIAYLALTGFWPATNACSDFSSLRGLLFLAALLGNGCAVAMKFPSLVATTILAACSLSSFAADGWLSDFEKAKAQAGAEKKVLLMDFTGSDWCEYCIRLNNEVFSTPAFKKAAPADFVLLELDFPQNESKLPEATRKQNDALQNTYSVEGYPTILLADSQGRPFARTGYRKGGVEEYLKHLQSLRAVLTQRDAAFDKAAALSGIEKARMLKEGLSVVPEEMIPMHYGTTLDEIKGLDPQDSLGMQKSFAFPQALHKLRARLKAKLLEGGVAIRAEADSVVAENPQWAAQQKQKALLYVLNFLMRPKDDATALKLVKDIKALGEGTEEGKIAESIRAQLERAK